MSVLSQFGVDLTELALARKLDALVEGPRIMDVSRLARSFISFRIFTPVLVGAPGVGKTALVRLVARDFAIGRMSSSTHVPRIGRTVEIDLAQVHREARNSDTFARWLADIAGEASATGALVFLDNMDVLFDLEAGFYQNLAISVALKRESNIIGALKAATWERLVSELSPYVHRMWPQFVEPMSPEDSIRLVHKLVPDLVLRHRVLIGGNTNYKGFDLRVMPPMDHVSGMLREGKCVIVLAAVREEFHIQIFDSDGEKVVNAHEKHLTDVFRGRAKLQRVEDLKKQLEGL
jgi:ATP-dependent Clp protease ATP-binding subunit ClpA